MAPYPPEIGKRLSVLLQRIREDGKGFGRAADNAKHPGLKDLFDEKSHQRTEFYQILKRELLDNGLPISVETDKDKGRTWMDIKALFSTDSDEAMLREAVSVENSAMGEYDKLLSEIDLYSTTREILRSQRAMISNDKDTLKAMAGMF
ncbi:MAG: DUF2383 domain-containing protein [Sediminicola sp.]|tara:strand:- start:20974 stop:21417 length:444 start_codon:yes stop_codon:yes gene_type:complete